MENSRDSSDTKMGDLDDRKDSEEEARRTKRKKNKSKSKKKGAVISREELRWIWYDDNEVIITKAEETWNLGKQLGIKSLEMDSSMAKKIEKMICLENEGSIKGKKQKVMLRGGKRSLSDHVPIYIEECKKDWGPRPLKIFNQWIHHPSYKGLIEKVWASSLKQGWVGFVIKEKLKELKTQVNAWSRETFNGMDRRIEDKKDEIGKLDILDDTFGLEEEEISRRQDLLGDLIMETSWRESQLLQKSKLKWLKEGDVNSNFFHNWVKRRYKRNEIMGLWNNNSWVESVQGVKQLVYEHFKK
ncbi:hypothetical protein ACS0TY_030606 [Phlomoides rotata]